jgi:tetratricopeptide (TPR) repeat protein
MSIRFGRALVSAACVLACSVGRVSAQSAPPATPPVAQAAAPAPAKPAEPTLEAKERARTSYTRGQEAFNRGDYAYAQAAFEEAFANVPNPIVLLSVAESAAKAKRIEIALAAYDRYLQLKPDAADRADVEQRRASLAASPAQLSITSDPAGAEVWVDGQATGHKTPTQFEVSPGAHQVLLVLAGYESDALPLQAAPGASLEHAIALRALAPPTPAAATLPPPAAEVIKPAAPLPAEPPTAAIWITGSLGVVGIITGSVLGVLALKEHSDFNKHPTEASADRGERLALFADVGFGIGAMALVTTAVLLLTHDDTPPPEQPSAARLQIIPTVTTAGASATAKVRF